MEEMGYELRSMIGSDVWGNTVFGEDMEEEQLSQSGGINGVMHGDEYALLRQVIHNDEDGGESGWRWKMFNEMQEVQEET